MTDDRDELFERLEVFLRMLRGALDREGLDQLAELDLTMNQARALFVLAHAGRSLTMTEVAQATGHGLPGAGRTVDTLVRLGLVDRQENPEDRRVKRVALTEQGMAVLDAQHEHKRRALRTFAHDLPDPHAAALNQALRGLISTAARDDQPDQKESS